MKGIETLPFQMVASAILIALVVSIGWYEINNFLVFKSQKDFKESMINIYQSMKDLQTVSDEGAFTGVILNIPSGWKIDIDFSRDNLIGKDSNGNIVYSFKTDCIDLLEAKDIKGNSMNSIPSSVSEIRLIYGTISDLPNNALRFKNGC